MIKLVAFTQYQGTSVSGQRTRTYPLPVIHPALILVTRGTLPSLEPRIQSSMRPIDVTEPLEQYPANHENPVFRHGQFEPRDVRHFPISVLAVLLTSLTANRASCDSLHTFCTPLSTFQGLGAAAAGGVAAAAIASTTPTVAALRAR